MSNMGRTTAIGIFVGIHPSWPVDGVPESWYVVAYDKRGNWKSGSICKSEAEARKNRSTMFNHHRNLARERGPSK